MEPGHDREAHGFLGRTCLSTRIPVYERIADILLRLRITHALDCGCAYGVLVELLNSRGIDAWGADLDDPEIRKYHGRLQLSKGKFYYGDITTLNLDIPRTGSCLVVLDTLRYISEPQRLSQLGTEYIVIKEVTSNPVMRWLRRGEFDNRMYSPLNCAALFPEYKVAEVHTSRFIFKVTHPQPLTLSWLNLLPTYTLVLRRGSDLQRQADQDFQRLSH